MTSIAIEPNVFYTLDEVSQLLRVSRAAALLNLGDPQVESESAHVRDWLAASNTALREVWDNEEDAVYDQL